MALSEFGDPVDGAAAYTSVQMLSCFLLFLVASVLHSESPSILLTILGAVLLAAYVSGLFFEFKHGTMSLMTAPLEADKITILAFDQPVEIKEY